MADVYEKGVRSKAHLFGHPIHPMLIPFPIAFLCGALVTDLVYWGTGDPFWARVSAWLISAGFATGFIASIPGMIDFATIDRVRRHAAGWVHSLGNLAVMLLALVNVVVRWTGGEPAVLWTGLILSFCTTVLLVVTGWAGGELAYRYRIGVMSAEGENEGGEKAGESGRERPTGRRRAA